MKQVLLEEPTVFPPTPMEPGSEAPLDVLADAMLPSSTADELAVLEAVTPQPAPSPFAALGLGEASLRAAVDLGYGEPTLIQTRAIPLLLAGRDVVAEAPTGTGKTAAYGFPIVEQFDPADRRPQALIMVPTRELAIQVAAALHGLGRHRELVAFPIYGGSPYERQFRALERGIHAVVGTPGRIIDHLNRGTLRLDSVRTVVLDEADEMLNMGFIDDIQAILAALPTERQTALFSATLAPRVVRLAQQHLTNPAQVSVAAKQAIAPLVEQIAYEVPPPAKLEALSRIIDIAEPASAIIFVGTRREADAVTEYLVGLGYQAQTIHGDVTQVQRERVLQRFRSGITRILVGTDVAARGLDIPDVSHVINYDVPPDAESYVHRIGRTGRAGQSGHAITMVTPRERRLLGFIERGIRRRIELLRPPSREDIAAHRRRVFRDRVRATIELGELDGVTGLLDELTTTHELRAIAAAALKLAAGNMVGVSAAPVQPGALPTRLELLRLADSEPTDNSRRAAAFASGRTPNRQPPWAAADAKPARPEPWQSPRVDHDGGLDGDRPPRQGQGLHEGPADSPAVSTNQRPNDEAKRPEGFPRSAAATIKLTPKEARLVERMRTPTPGPRKAPPTVRGVSQGGSEDSVELMLRVGTRDGVRKSDLVGAIANEAGLSGAMIGNIQIFDTFSFVSVPRAAATRVEAALKHTTIRGRFPRVTRSQQAAGPKPRR